MVTCLLLTAGLSGRFGSPKALALLKQNTVIEHLQNILLQTACDKIIVVLGAAASMIEPYLFKHKRIRIVHNKDYDFGQTSSVQTGLRNIGNKTTGIMLLPVDCPLIRVSTFDLLIDHFKKERPDILIPTCGHQKGHPPIFHVRLKPEILDLPLNAGINSLFMTHLPHTLEIDDPGINKTFNTREEFKTIVSFPD